MDIPLHSASSKILGLGGAARYHRKCLRLSSSFIDAPPWQTWSNPPRSARRRSKRTPVFLKFPKLEPPLTPQSTPQAPHTPHPAPRNPTGHQTRNSQFPNRRKGLWQLEGREEDTRRRQPCAALSMYVPPAFRRAHLRMRHACARAGGGPLSPQRYAPQFRRLGNVVWNLKGESLGRGWATGSRALSDSGGLEGGHAHCASRATRTRRGR
ncbi:hypothetical protein C2E23DRAFT_615097 [Lenzites betulinus]|nr:hypothetical protein C2E23DRAFT_615097 [Lenzites betulinus]